MGAAVEYPPPGEVAPHENPTLGVIPPSENAVYPTFVRARSRWRESVGEDMLPPGKACVDPSSLTSAEM
jgi:hypothetical protein